ncbi:unnamed protein product [Cunninghamella blakesleeana]
MEQNNLPSNRQRSPFADHEQHQQPSTYTTNTHISSPEKWDQYGQHDNTARNGTSSPYSVYPSYSQQQRPTPSMDLSHQRDIWNNAYPRKPLQTTESHTQNSVYSSHTNTTSPLLPSLYQSSPISSKVFDPVRNGSSGFEEHQISTKDTEGYEQNKTISPVMSISQLLSSDTPTSPISLKSSLTTTGVVATAPTTAPDQTYDKLSLDHPRQMENLQLEESKNQIDDKYQLSQSSSFRNGIHNLLNSDTEDNTADPLDVDVNTDLEDISVNNDNDSVSLSVSNGKINQKSKPKSSFSQYRKKSGAGHHSKRFLSVMISDDSSTDEYSDLDGGNTSDDNDDSILELHKGAIVEYMLTVHRKKKAAIESYESKRNRRHKKMKDELEQLYEKQYGNDMWQLRGGLKIPSALLEKIKQDKERFKVKQHTGFQHILKRSNNGNIKKLQRSLLSSEQHIQQRDHVAEDVVQSETSDDGEIDELDYLDPVKAQMISQKRMEAERKRVWLEIARTDIPRMSRILTRVQATRVGNCKKLAQYCQKEVKRAATKSGRATKDTQLKAKRAQKEMLLFWKKNEKEERELRKKAEREALEKLRQEEERREAQRQARKLNFLITQTELYSHFIGRKINKDVTEDDETMPQSEDVTPNANENDENMDVDITSYDKSLGEIDFDEDDEETIKQHARISAQNALAKQRERTKAFDEGAKQRRQAANEDVNMQDQLDTMNFQEPSSMGSGPEIKQPSILMCQLKSYQLKGLNWLANLYEQGINGILADEMGLGKTVQSISLMAYLAEVHNIWGPFLVIAPASTLHNWQQEISRFVPSFRALPYWGNPKERKILRQSWTRKQLYGRDAPFHVVITSYQLVLTDVNYFQRVKWQYMVLDEAQAIKSSSSARWKMLLGFHCRNRLLLTGTPIQNSMQELWALLHFIMPTLFDSHEEFSEWFSKDIESHAENKGTLNEHQLRRLHMILKPFMLRRIKRNVQHELGEKIEIEVYCELTARQKTLYRGLKEKISIAELLEKATSLGDTESMDSLMNLVMQFRKVCNHPELFERADVESPFAFCEFGESGPLSKEQFLHYSYSTKSKIKYHLPKQIYRDGGILNAPGINSKAGFSTRYLDNLMNIWSSDYIYETMHSDEHDNAFSFLRFVDTSAQEASNLFKHSLVSRWLHHLVQKDHRARRRFYNQANEYSYPNAPINTYAKLLITDVTSETNPSVITDGSPMDELTHIGDKIIHTVKLFDNNYFPRARSVPVDVHCCDPSFVREQRDILFNPTINSCLLGNPQYVKDIDREIVADLQQVVTESDGKGIMTIPSSGNGYSQMKVPAMKDLILDSGKLATLDKLLEKLKSDGHRCLIYFQMTRMIDLFEEYISYKQYKYLRLDGSSKISDRRDMVQDWQTRPEIFIFLLSTRAGGLGINLTAADTVIFYDSDWNPTVDQQAMDRAHRLGQTRQVTVYRLLTKGTIEERILMRAKQKDEIQKVVISGGEFKQVDFKPREIVSLLLDDEELENKLAQQLKRKNTEDENVTAPTRPTKRNKKQSSKESTPAQSPYNVDKLFSAGGDTLPEDDMDSLSKKKTIVPPSATDKKGRTGRPRTNFSFTR